MTDTIEGCDTNYLDRINSVKTVVAFFDLKIDGDLFVVCY